MAYCLRAFPDRVRYVIPFDCVPSPLSQQVHGQQALGSVPVFEMAIDFLE